MHFSEEAYELASESKQLHIVLGAGHGDLYDRVNLIPFAKLVSFNPLDCSEPAAPKWIEPGVSPLVIREPPS